MWRTSENTTNNTLSSGLGDNMVEIIALIVMLTSWYSFEVMLKQFTINQ